MPERAGAVAEVALPWGWLRGLPGHLIEFRERGYWHDLTVADCARQWAEIAPDRNAFPGLATPATYASLLTEAEALCTAIRSLGIMPGEVISFQTPNWVEAAVINLAAALGGFVVNPIVIIYRDAEVRQMLADSRSRLMFICESFRGYDFAAMMDRIKPDLPDLAHVAFVRSGRPDCYDDMVASGRNVAFSPADPNPDTVKLLLYTSGTTGRPKGVLHSHNTLARVMARSAAQWRVEPGDVLLMPSPVTHISGYCNGLEFPFIVGSSTVLMETWQADEAVALIDRYAIVGTVAATPFLQELALAAPLHGTRLPSLRFFACGGAAVAPDIIRTANVAFQNCQAFRVFGSSEVPLVTLGWPCQEDAELAATTDGEIVDYEVRVEDEDGRALPVGEPGEILARGPAMLLGYVDKAQTSEAITPDGFFRTGDIGVLTPEGAIRITDRKKDLIIRGGENISAKEIEDVLMSHPGIAEASVVAMPHARLGESICAFVLLRDQSTLDRDSLLQTMRESGLARQKTPERIEALEVFPRTASGKIRKDLLRERAKAYGPA